MDAGVEHFGRLLKRAFELPLSGMSISLMFSLSHAHIEGAAQLRRWGKAEDTIGKLKEIAEFASENKIPNAIESISDRLHLWWREKRANIYSRQVRLPTRGLHRHAVLCGVALPRVGFVSLHQLSFEDRRASGPDRPQHQHWTSFLLRPVFFNVSVIPAAGVDRTVMQFVWGPGRARCWDACC